jgi:NADH-quinone oxidoreductase subunit L
MVKPELPAQIAERTKWLYVILLEKYGFDRFNDWFFAGGTRNLGTVLWKIGDMKLIDGLLVNGTAQTVGWLASIIRYLQTGLLYHYVFIMIIGLALLLGVFVF